MWEYEAAEAFGIPAAMKNLTQFAAEKLITKNINYLRLRLFLRILNFEFFF